MIPKAILHLIRDRSDEYGPKRGSDEWNIDVQLAAERRILLNQNFHCPTLDELNDPDNDPNGSTAFQWDVWHKQRELLKAAKGDSA